MRYLINLNWSTEGFIVMQVTEVAIGLTAPSIKASEMVVLE